MSTYLVIALGSALGGMARYWSSVALLERFGPAFPYGTLAVNIVGSFVIGLVATLSAPDGRLFGSSELRVFFVVGLCGGFTTFSSFSFETLDLLRNGQWLRGGLYIGLSLAVCLLAVWLGYVAAVLINPSKG